MKTLLYAIILMVASAIGMPTTQATPTLLDDHGIVITIMMLTSNESEVHYVELPETLITEDNTLAIRVRIVDDNRRAIYQGVFNDLDIVLPLLELSEGDYSLEVEVGGLSSSTRLAFSE